MCESLVGAVVQAERGWAGFGLEVNGDHLQGLGSKVFLVAECLLLGVLQQLLILGSQDGSGCSSVWSCLSAPV